MWANSHVFDTLYFNPRLGYTTETPAQLALLHDASSAHPVILVPSRVADKPYAALSGQPRDWDAITSAAAMLSVERTGRVLASRWQTHGRC